MPPYVTMILCAIHSAIKLDQKTRKEFEEEGRDHPIFLLPVGITHKNKSEQKHKAECQRR